MSETKKAVGTLDGTEIKNGWHKFSINFGTKYPLVLATKKQPLIDAAMGSEGKTVEWVYSERESDKINEHTGKPFVNRYLEEVHEATDSAKPTIPVGNGGSRNESIERQTIIKAALGPYVASRPDSFSRFDFFKLLDECAAWVSKTTPAELSPEEKALQELEASVPGAKFVDDDIPFAPVIW